MNTQQELNEQFRVYVCERHPDWSEHFVPSGSLDPENDFASLVLFDPRGIRMDPPIICPGRQRAAAGPGSTGLTWCPGSAPMIVAPCCGKASWLRPDCHYLPRWLLD